MIYEECMISPALKHFVIGRGLLEQCAHCGNEATGVDEMIVVEHIVALFESTLVPFDALPQMTKVDIDCGADLPIREIFDRLDFHPPSKSERFNSQLCEALELEFVDPNALQLIDQCFMINDVNLTDNEFTVG
ncbi:hypothetical protein JF535_11355 [Microbulbifer salipaludis]|uniref:Uncharacterized protein n=1 Tax=Microbulbifer salipaludis TaxID=187980 RepID=A0ABS3E820_9GAMM|nr:hypothetical protein [Microbulbifer salipaludis]MBN8431449.1 hypothetical protein [Microbulbifer salipaludis]